jgi:hypothetical protein
MVRDRVPTHGKRTASYFVLHTTEGNGTVESYGRYFRNTAVGLGTTFVLERDGRLGQMAELDDRTYHVKSHNSEMIGVEQVGFAATSRLAWLTLYRRQLFMAAWLIAWVSQELDIPVQLAVDHGRTLARHGVLQHRQVPDNDHDDCGNGYPVDFVMKWAGKWRHSGGPTLLTRRYIRTGVRK